MQAVRKGDLKEVQKLIKKGANVNYEDVAMQRQTCLHQAATWNHTAVLQTLVEAKAKIDVRRLSVDSALAHVFCPATMLSCAVLALRDSLARLALHERPPCGVGPIA